METQQEQPQEEHQAQRGQQSFFKPDEAYRMPHIEDMQWSPSAIVKAMAKYLSKDEQRPTMKFIHLNDRFAEATDGHRAIRIGRSDFDSSDSIPNGSFRPVKDGKDYLLVLPPKELQLPGPNLDAVFPAEWEHQFNQKGFAGDGHTSVAITLKKLAAYKIALSHLYMVDVPTGDYVVLVRGPKEPVVFMGEPFISCIMPIDVKEGD